MGGIRPLSSLLLGLAALAVAGGLLASRGSQAQGGEPGASPAGGGAAPPNLVLVSMDTCRWDHYSYRGYSRPTTPSVDRVVAAGTSFDLAFSQSNETLYSHSSLMTSRYPGDIAPVDKGFYLPDSFYTVAEVLKLYGYATAGFTGGAHVKRTFGLGQGFDLYLDDLDFASLYHGVPSASLWLEEHAAGPFFVFLHGYDCHSPYHKPLLFDGLYTAPFSKVVEAITHTANGIERIYNRRSYRRLPIDIEKDQDGREVLAEDFFHETLPDAERKGVGGYSLSEADMEGIVAHYDSGLTYGDLFVGLFMDRLQQMNLLDNTAVVIVADHGEALTDTSWVHHRPTLSEGVVHVPLVVHAPFLPPSRGRKVDSIVELVDVMPTLLDLAGAPPPAGMVGHSLVPLLKGDTAPVREAAFTEARSAVSVRLPEGLLILNKRLVADRSPAQLLDLPVDGQVWQWWPQGQAPVPADARARLLEWWTARSPAVRGEGKAPDPALEKALRERGYW